MWLYLEREVGIADRELQVLHVAPERGISKRLGALRGVTYAAIDLAGREGAQRADLTELPFGQEFDLILCSHVLEHIPDDRKAMGEMRRVLRPSGIALMQHPIGREQTYEDASIIEPKDRERAFGQHDHVRIYGRDLLDRLRQVGFEVDEINYIEEVTMEQRSRFRLERDGQAEPIHLCH
jgi:SAM-dependent methyltransferase